ncbi:MAG: hypothetical protein FWF56_05160 [Firmicutes bacterium]|nr:hypothetical protein [Bacillota bacterium]
MSMVVVLIVLSISILPLGFHIDGRLDMFVHGGAAKLYFLGIRIFRLNLRLEQNGSINTVYIERFKSKKVLGKVNLTTDTTDSQSIVSIMTGSVLGNLRVSDCFVKVEIGRKSDAIFTAIGLSIFRIAYTAFISYVKSWQRIRTEEKFLPLYEKNIFNIQFLCILKINIADIIYGTLVQLLTKRKKEKRKLSLISEA